MKAKTKLIARITLLVGLCLPIASLAGDMLHMNPQSIEQKGNVSINILGDWRVSIIEIDGAFTRIPEFAKPYICKLIAIKYLVLLVAIALCLPILYLRISSRL